MNQTRRMNSQDDVHAWTIKRLAPFAAGLLNDTEEQQLRRHLEACTPCSERHRLLLEQPTEAEDFAHIPAGIMATWATASARLQGLERDMVEHHLERCADCREDLVVLGFEPALAPAVLAGATAEPQAWPARVAQRRRNTWLALDWTRWVVGTWAATATAAVVLMLSTVGGPATILNRLPLTATYQTETPPTEVMVALNTPPAPTATPSVNRPSRTERRTPQPRMALVDPARPRSATRGVGDDETPVINPIPPAKDPLLLTVDGYDLPEYPNSTRTNMRFIGPDGSVLVRMDTTLAAIKAKATITISDGQIFRPGEYELRFVFALPEPARADSVSRYYVLGEVEGE
jgi:hypothetical protein